MRIADVTPWCGTGLRTVGDGWSRRVPALSVVVLLATLYLAHGFALDITTTDGQTYWNCTVTKVEPDALRIMYRDGAARILYEKLPPALQKQYFDPAKVAAYHQQIEDEKRAAEARAAAAAEEERRQKAIAAAKAEEERELAEEKRKQEEAARHREAEEEKAMALRQRLEHVAARHRKELLLAVLIGVAGLLSVFLYFLPSIIGRRKSNAAAIFVLNLFLGWTVIGWVVAMIWAATRDSAMEELARQRVDEPLRPVPRNPRTIDVYSDRELENGRRYLE